MNPPHPVNPVHPVPNPPAPFATFCSNSGAVSGSVSVSHQIEQLEARKAELLRLRDLQFEVEALERGIFLGPASRHWLPIISAVCREFNITLGELISRTRLARVTEARMACYYLIKHLNPKTTLSEIGAALERDHGSVHSGIQSIQNRMDTDPPFRTRINTLITSLSQT